MAIGLEEAWKCLSLTAEEEVVVECEDEVMDNKAEQMSLYLWGKLLTDSYFNANAMKNIFKNKLSKGVIIRDIDKNLFAFQFFFVADKGFVLNEGPWAFDGNIIILKELSDFEKPSNIQFTRARRGRPSNQAQTSASAKVLEDNLRSLWVTLNQFYTADKLVNFQVDADVPKPLRRGMRVMVKGKPIWVSFKYVKLSEFCCGYGHVGHVLSACEFTKDINEDSELPYGNW
ncbi:LOW QUALITY PROTEIN: hypothetical protein Cgig2_010440 [Carnegiea gigantea]|uniref:DUF4283 domain-containing protein n=1 Tax=Carnegiea gigantea TaxID=171969 RepID=A0A9Q1GSI5_9CARY|nr:LOW QUALITY PROTEIN: hypothetical protein Cgig2_010440 [Carnegiea gigantea]